MTDRTDKNNTEKPSLHERLAGNKCLTADITQEIKEIEEQLIKANNALSNALRRNAELSEEVDELQSDVCFCGGTDSQAHAADELTRLMNAILQKAQSDGPLNDIQNDALHFMRTEGLIRW